MYYVWPESFFSVMWTDSRSCCHQLPALNRNQYWDLTSQVYKENALAIFASAFKAASLRLGLKKNITLMTLCNCLLSSSDKLAEWTKALNSVSLSLQWQLHCRDSKTCFSISFLRKPFYPYVFLFIFCLILGDSIFSSLWTKLMAVQELIVQACAWLPGGEWMWIRMGSWFTMTCFFSSSSRHRERRRGHGRALKMGVNRSSTKALKPISIQPPTKEKNHRTHRRW